MQALPNAGRPFRDVGLSGAQGVYLEVLVGAVAEQLRAAWAEVGEPGEELLGRRGGRLVKGDHGRACSFQVSARGRANRPRASPLESAAVSADAEQPNRPLTAL